MFVYECFPLQDRVSLYSPDCPGPYSVDQAGLELRDPPASASQVLGLLAGSAMLSMYECSACMYMCLSVCVCVLYACLVPKEARRLQIP